MMGGFWKDRRVLITGHTGFKGCWLAKWLDILGAYTLGLSLPPDKYSVYDKIKFSNKHDSEYIDVRDRSSITVAIASFSPEIIFHLAAQAIVGKAKDHPVETFETNLMGTVNILEATAETTSVKAAIIITSDKVYENTETLEPYKEDARFGGDEPYAASKSCAELAVMAYRNVARTAAGIATARAANVYGGGDLHYDRLMPYLIRTKLENRVAEVRNPGSVRPWQHVLSPLKGYLLLAEALYNDPSAYSEGFNFGPPENELLAVSDLADMITNGADVSSTQVMFKEARILRIDSSKSRERLGWKPVTDIRSGLKSTIEFYRAMYSGEDLASLMKHEIMGAVH